MINASFALRTTLKVASTSADTAHRWKLLSKSLRFAFSSSSSTIGTSLKESYDNVLVETRGKVGLVTLNRPKALNALCDALFDDLLHATKALDKDPNIGCLVLTGSSKGK
jgi:hypothetical protein